MVRVNIHNAILANTGKPKKFLCISLRELSKNTRSDEMVIKTQPLVELVSGKEPTIVTRGNPTIINNNELADFSFARKFITFTKFD